LKAQIKSIEEEKEDTTKMPRNSLTYPIRSQYFLIRLDLNYSTL